MTHEDVQNYPTGQESSDDDRAYAHDERRLKQKTCSRPFDMEAPISTSRIETGESSTYSSCETMTIAAGWLNEDVARRHVRCVVY